MDTPSPFVRSAFAQRFLSVCQQLDALQPVSIASPQSHPHAASALVLPSRDRMAQIFAANERFRPCEEARASSGSSTKEAALSVTTSATTAATTTAVSGSLSSSPTRVARSPSSPLSPTAAARMRNAHRPVLMTNASESRKDVKARAPAATAVHVPVGGRARILPTQSLQRAKAALKKRSNALANLQPTASGGLAPDKRRVLHNAPDSTWEALRHSSALNSCGGGTSHGPLSALGQSQSQQSHQSLQQSQPGKQALIAELVHKTHFSTQSIFQMSRKFKLIAGAAKSVISFDEFRQIMSEDVGDLLLSIGVLGPAGAIATSSDAEDAGAGDTITTVAGDTAAAATALPPPCTPDMTAIGATISSSETFLRRLFLTFDVDGDGKIDFREFVVGLNGFVKGTPEEKVHALFEIYKSDATAGKGTVAISDLLGLFQGDRHLYQELMRCVDEYFARVELRDELQPTMKEDEFVATSIAEPHLLDMVSRPVPSRRYASEAHVRDKVRAFIEQKQINWKKLLLIHRRMGGYTRSLTSGGSGVSRAAVSRRSSSVSGVLTPIPPATLPTTPLESLRGDESDATSYQTLAIPVADFHQILVECLGPTSALEDEALTQSILLAYVATPREKLMTPSQATTLVGFTPLAGDLNSERREKPARRGSIMEHYVAHVSCGELSQDIAVALQTALTAEHDADSKARYYFELYDQDGDGLLSRSELCTAICAGFGHFGQSMMDVVRILEDEDADQDGEVTKDEYMRAATKSPLILASLYTCLQREV